jgi:hypothetical protein
MHKRMLIALCALSLSLTGLARADGHDGGDDRGQGKPSDQKVVRANLSGPAIGGEKPTGTSRATSNDGQNKFTVEVEDVNLPDATVLTVVLVHGDNRTRVGDMLLSQGTAELERRTRDGDQVPQPQSGDSLLVMQGRTHVLAGVYF